MQTKLKIDEYFEKYITTLNICCPDRLSKFLLDDFSHYYVHKNETNTYNRSFLNKLQYLSIVQDKFNRNNMPLMFMKKSWQRKKHCAMLKGEGFYSLYPTSNPLFITQIWQNRNGRWGLTREWVVQFK